MSGRKLREIAGKLRGAATDLDIVAEELETKLGKDALEVMERSCQGKRAYTTPEAAGQAATDRGVTGLRVYECTFCRQFHLTKLPFEAFAAKR